MRNISELRFLCSSFCKQYQSEAKFYIDEAHSSGERHLVVVYEKGGYDGAKDFAVGIPKDWTDRDVIDLILWDLPNAQYPVWEVSARAYHSPMLDNSDRRTGVRQWLSDATPGGPKSARLMAHARRLRRLGP